MNIYQKLIEVRKEVPYLQKGENGPQFKYVSSSQVLAACKAKMDELQLLLIPQIINAKVTESTVEYTEKSTYNGVTTEKPKKTTTYFTELNMAMMWVNAENPEENIICSWYGQGVDIAGEKGVGKALTYAEKYFMLKFFNIPTDKDDPDSFQEKQEKKDEGKKENGSQTSKMAPNLKDDIKGRQVISEAQIKRMFALSKGNTAIILDVCTKHGYKKDKDIKQIDYDKICKEIEARVKEDAEFIAQMQGEK